MAPEQQKQKTLQALPDDPAAHRRAAAGALCHGRPALGRSDHPGIPHPPGRSRPHRPYPGAVDLSARLQPALDGALASHPGDAAALAASAGDGDDRPGGHGKALPAEVVEQVVAKTDGVPLFVEELTKMVLESGLLQEREDRYELTGPLPPLAIPTTLHDSLMARLDRLATVKGLAQLGATLGREFSYDLLQAVSPWDEETLQRGLHQLVEAEFLYQQGLPPQATYLFKHALIQDAAYQSLAAQHPPAVPSAHCPGVGGALSRPLRDPARAPGPALHRGGPYGASHSLLAARAGRAGHLALGLCRSD